MARTLVIVYYRRVQGIFFLIALSVIGCGPAPARQAEIAIENAIENGDIDTLRRMLDEGFDPNHVFPGHNRGYRLVHVAAQYANLEAMKLLVSRNADINLRDHFRGETPLMVTVGARNSYGIADDRYLEVFEYFVHP